MDCLTLITLKMISWIKATFCPDPSPEIDESILFTDGTLIFEDDTRLILNDEDLEMIQDGDTCMSFISKIRSEKDFRKEVVRVSLSYIYDNKYNTHTFYKDDVIEPNLKT